MVFLKQKFITNMSVYDKYYKTENLFGEPYPELIQFFSAYPTRGKLLDLGCGQGRDAIALAKLGYEVTGIDHSSVGINQMVRRAKEDNLQLSGLTTDIYAYDKINEFDFILLDSMFHFEKTDKVKEIAFLEKILTQMMPDALLVVCIQDTGKKVEILNKTIRDHTSSDYLVNQKLTYVFTDDETGHQSVTDYRMIALKK